MNPKRESVGEVEGRADCGCLFWEGSVHPMDAIIRQIDQQLATQGSYKKPLSEDLQLPGIGTTPSARLMLAFARVYMVELIDRVDGLTNSGTVVCKPNSQR